MAMMVEAFSQEQVQRITGLSRTQLDYWDRTDVIRPSIAEAEGRGSPRLYSFRDLIKLKVASKMRRKLRPAQMRDLMRQLEARGFDDPFVTVQFKETSGGRQIVYIDPEHGPLSAHGREVGTQVESFGLPLRDLRTGLEQSVEKAFARKPGRITQARGLHGGQPVIAGTRVPVAKLVALSDAGWDNERILAAFPHLDERDIAAALRHRPKPKVRTA
jgi:uncharacterized protein (DUF433 family)